MPLPRALATFNASMTNRMLRPIAGRLGGFAVVEHRGRRSGRRYETPVNVFEDGDRIVIPCMYGRQSDWVANVIAGGGCSLVRRGATSTWTAPEVIGRDAATAIPPPVRLVLSGLSVEDVMRLSPGSRTEN